MVMVDYIQLLRSENKDLARNREREISAMVDQLRDFGKANRCPVFGISNLSKSKDMNDERGPDRNDLKGSSDVYYSADRVWFVHRSETNFVTKEPQSKYSPTWCLLLNQDKQRAGPTLRLYLRCTPSYGGIKIYPDQPALREMSDKPDSAGGKQHDLIAAGKDGGANDVPLFDENPGW